MRRTVKVYGSAGFTLIELVGVMAIMVVLAGMLLPSFVRAQRDARLRASTRRVLAALNLARSTAIAEKTHARLEIDSRHGVFGMTTERRLENGETRFVPEVSSLGRAQVLPEGIHIGVPVSALRAISSRENFITFYEDGRADEMVVVLRDDSGSQRTLSVDGMTGRVRLDDRAIGDRR